jgi:3-hydroxyisobutyrate dehydrogenase-like beta-hydroxyacid dehydrogenase
MQNRQHSCFFSAVHAAKDNGIALELARNLGLDLPLARATKEQYDRMIAEGLGELDKSASPSSHSRIGTNGFEQTITLIIKGITWRL